MEIKTNVTLERVTFLPTLLRIKTDQNEFLYRNLQSLLSTEGTENITGPSWTKADKSSYDLILSQVSSPLNSGNFYQHYIGMKAQLILMSVLYFDLDHNN